MLAALAEVFWFALALCAVVGLVLFLAQFFPTPEPPDVERKSSRSALPLPGSVERGASSGCRAIDRSSGGPHYGSGKQTSGRSPRDGEATHPTHAIDFIDGRDDIGYRVHCTCLKAISYPLPSIAACHSWMTVHADVEDHISTFAPRGEQ